MGSARFFSGVMRSNYNRGMGALWIALVWLIGAAGTFGLVWLLDRNKPPSDAGAFQGLGIGLGVVAWSILAAAAEVVYVLVLILKHFHL